MQGIQHMKINAELVKKLRADKQWSQEQLAAACGLNLRTIQRLENTGNASIESVRALAAVFAVDASSLLLSTETSEVVTPTPLSVIKDCFVQFADFTGTASKYDYWWFLVFVLLVSALAEIISPALRQFVTVLILLPFLAVGTRRLNDAGQNVWWQLMYLVPFGFVVVLFFMAKDSIQQSALSVPPATDAGA
jgi:transcriptional regulator with XRE-family HTH domain